MPEELLSAPAGAAGAAPAPGEATATTPAEKSGPRSWTDTFAAAREEVEAAKAEGRPIKLDGAPDATPNAATAGEGAEDGGEGEEDLGAPAEGEDNPLEVELLPRRDGEDGLRILADDPETADALRALTNRAAEADRAEQTLELADSYRQQAEEQQFVVRADPVGYVAAQMRDPNDQVHLARSLMVQPHVFEALREYMGALLENPEALPHERELVEAQNIKRREGVGQRIEAERTMQHNIRQVSKTATKTIESVVPIDWKPEQRTQMYRDVMRDLSERASAENLQTVDPKIVAGAVLHRLSQYGLQPRGANGTPKGKQPQAASGKPAPRTGPTGAQLVASAEARRRASGAGPGVGSPTAAVPPLPDMKGMTSADRWKTTFAHARKVISTLRRSQ